jgi:hypothetical protein
MSQRDGFEIPSGNDRLLARRWKVSIGCVVIEDPWPST